ncbi:MAG: hypothetical protein DMG80_05900 [Acidobacteria bacterium]|nr:MAG: hypothetical protein DMG80_05900 [Acidobacteriota bacterium]
MFVTLVLLAIRSLAAAQNTLYDNFNSALINPDNWVGLEASGPDTREAKREIVPTPGVQNDHRLHLLRRAYSATTDNAGATGDAFGLLFPSPNTVTAVSFTAVVKKGLAAGCSGTSAVSGISAGFAGSFFNPSSSPNGATGDMRAFIAIIRNSTDVGKNLTVSVATFQCNDAICGAQTVLFSQALGVVPSGSSNILGLTWDHPNHRFVFQLNSNAPVVSTYTIGDGFPPASAYKYISLDRAVPRCTSTPRPYAFMDASFDNVFVNP